MIELVGWIGSTLLALCSIPEVIIAYSTSKVGLSWAFLLIWIFGEIFALIYTLSKAKKVKLLPLIFNYGLNIICLGYIIGVKYV